MNSESKPDAFLGDGATCVLWVGPPCRRTFSLEGKVLIVFASLYLKLHMFTYQCLRNPIFGMLFFNIYIIKYYHLCPCCFLAENKIRSILKGTKRSTTQIAQSRVPSFPTVAMGLALGLFLPPYFFITRFQSPKGLCSVVSIVSLHSRLLEPSWTSQSER